MHNFLKDSFTWQKNWKNQSKVFVFCFFILFYFINYIFISTNWNFWNQLTEIVNWKMSKPLVDLELKTTVGNLSRNVSVRRQRSGSTPGLAAVDSDAESRENSAEARNRTAPPALSDEKAQRAAGTHKGSKLRRKKKRAVRTVTDLYRRDSGGEKGSRLDSDSSPRSSRRRSSIDTSNDTAVVASLSSSTKEHHSSNKSTSRTSKKAATADATENEIKPAQGAAVLLAGSATDNAYRTAGTTEIASISSPKQLTPSASPAGATNNGDKQTKNWNKTKKSPLSFDHLKS